MNQDWMVEYLRLNASIILASSLLAFLLITGALWRPNVARMVVKIVLAVVVLVVVIVASIVILEWLALI